MAYVPIKGVTPEEVRANKVDQLCGFQEIKCHIVFDVKMDFILKARFVAGGHTTLNGLDLMSCDIGNAYLNAKC